MTFPNNASTALSQFIFFFIFTTSLKNLTSGGSDGEIIVTPAIPGIIDNNGNFFKHVVYSGIKVARRFIEN